MELNFHVNGAERKRLVQTISDWLGVPAKYCGAPTFNYEVDYFTIDRNGSLSFDDRADSEVIERLLQHIYDEGFDIDQSHTDDEEEPCAVCISMPRSLFTDSNLENLKALIASKGGLIKKAIGVSDLPLEITDTKVSFPWFPATPTPDEMNAYDTFICKLCEMARNQKRVSAAEKTTDNEKYNQFVKPHLIGNVLYHRHIKHIRAAGLADGEDLFSDFLSHGRTSGRYPRRMPRSDRNRYPRQP